MFVVIGGTGFLGTPLFENLIKAKYPVRVFVRGVNDWQNNALSQYRKLGADICLGDIRSREKLEKAVAGSAAVINLAGIMRENAEDKYYDIHVEATENLIAAAEKHGVPRVIHISCLGSSLHSNSEYYRTKAKGEELMRKGNFSWTIFRPSFMFDQSFVLFDILTPVMRKLPFSPMIGGGLNEIRPVWVQDVAACIMQSIYNFDTAGKTYDLVGPRVYTLSELMKIISDKLGKSKPTVDITSDFSMKIMKFYQKLKPDAVFNEELIQILTSDSVGQPEVMQNTFEVKMTSLDENLDRFVWKD